MLGLGLGNVTHSQATEISLSLRRVYRLLDNNIYCIDYDDWHLQAVAVCVSREQNLTQGSQILRLFSLTLRSSNHKHTKKYCSQYCSDKVDTNVSLDQLK